MSTPKELKTYLEQNEHLNDDEVKAFEYVIKVLETNAQSAQEAMKILSNTILDKLKYKAMRSDLHNSNKFNIAKAIRDLKLLDDA